MNCRPLLFAALTVIANTSTNSARAADSPPAAYLILAKNLADRHDGPHDSANTDIDLRQTLAASRQTLRDLLAVAATSAHRDLAAIANEGAEAELELLVQLKLLEALPKPPEADALVAEGLIRLLFRGFGILGRVEEIYRQDVNLRNAFYALSAARARREQAKLKLPVIAAYYAGPPVSNPALAIDYDAPWLPEQPDRLMLRNVSGRTLHHCTVLAELQGKNGGRSRSLFYLETWEPESAIYGGHEGAASVQNKPIGGTAVPFVQSLKISLWTDELSQEDRIYQYSGAESDRDVARRLSDMTIVSSYRPAGKGIFFDTQRGLQLRLHGAELPRAFKIVVQFHRGNKGKALEWTFASWKPDELKTLDTLAGDLPWDPEWYGLEIYFPELDYKWSDKRKIVVQR